jgi:hypothetical protein
MLASRQSGKSLTAAALALKAALLEPPALVLLLSPSQRQSSELFQSKVLPLWRDLGSPSKGAPPTQLSLTLQNGSRIISLPATEGTIRGYSGVKLLVIDEASRVPDALYFSCRPMLATSAGRLVALSTPAGKRGWFHDEWHGGADWKRVKIEAADCPRITPAFLAEERQSLGERWYAQEYECEFNETVGAVFAHADIHAAVTGDTQPLFED